MAGLGWCVRERGGLNRAGLWVRKRDGEFGVGSRRRCLVRQALVRSLVLVRDGGGSVGWWRLRGGVGSSKWQIWGESGGAQSIGFAGVEMSSPSSICQSRRVVQCSSCSESAASIRVSGKSGEGGSVSGVGGL